jgi:hypothetical protein
MAKTGEESTGQQKPDVPQPQKPDVDFETLLISGIATEIIRSYKTRTNPRPIRGGNQEKAQHPLCLLIRSLSLYVRLKRGLPDCFVFATECVADGPSVAVSAGSFGLYKKSRSLGFARVR